MKILLNGINYAPELTGIGKYTGEMAEWLAAQGHDVYVLTAMPYYPEWQVHESYRKKWWHKEMRNGVKVIRCPLYVPTNVTSLSRIVHEFSFVCSSLLVWLYFLLFRKFNLVVAIAPPFHLGFLALIYSKIRNARLISHIQDLQVDAAADLGMIKNKTFLNIMFGMEKFLLKNSDLVTTLSPGMKKKVLAKGIPFSKIALVPNWVDGQFVHPLSMEKSLRPEFGIPLNDKVVLYSGNLGEKQGLEVILKLAAHFSSSPDIHFIIVGSGGAKKKLEQQAADEKLTNLKFFPLQPYANLARLLAAADLHLVLQKSSASDLVMPSKLTGILAAGGCPVVTASPGTSLYDLVHENSLGIIVEPESLESLITGVTHGLSSDLQGYKQNAIRYAGSYLDKDIILKQFEDIAGQLTGIKGTLSTTPA